MSETAAPTDLVGGHRPRCSLARTACAGDAACLAEWSSTRRRHSTPGAIDLEPSQRTTSLLDDFGGVAVLRVDAVDGGDGGSARRRSCCDDDRWLLRDVHPAKQP